MPIIKILIPALLVQLLFSGSQALAAVKIQPAELQRWQEEKRSFYLVDVRSAQAYARKHIAGAISIPAFIVSRKGLPKGDSIVLYDGGIGTTETAVAAERLETAGYTKVTVLEGGLARWETSGFAVGAPTGRLNDALIEAIASEELGRIDRNIFELILVDLRDAASFKAGSLTGARNIQPAALMSTSSTWQKNAVVVLFDDGTREPEHKAELLRRAGFKLVRFLYGGYPAWKQQNKAQ
jgi:rhodanese-related sulfurtransferase